MLDAAAGRRDAGDVARLLNAPDNRGVSAPAPAHALYLDAVRYPTALYLDAAAAPTLAPALASTRASSLSPALADAA